VPELRTTRRDLRTLASDLRLGWRQAGPAGVLEELRARTLDRLWRSYHFLAVQTDLEHLPPVRCPPGVSIRPVREDDWPALESLIPARRLDFFRRGADTGMLGLAAWRGPTPVGYAWYRLDHPVDAHLVTFDLPENAMFLGPRYVLPSERSAGVGTALANTRLALGRAQGRRCSLSLVNPGDVASLVSLQHAAGPGAVRLLGELRHRRLLGRRRSTWRPAPPGEPLPAS
jgi:GNAT superfamily N-acetyltransferase